MSKEQAKEKIGQLVEKYKAEKSAGKISQYNEAETRTGFIEPLFQALGWDTQNRNEVGLEATVSSGRADYAFKISGLVKFFIEAKSIRADLDNPEFSQQTLNYAWHKGVYWAILSDFEAIKVFNAEVKTKTLNECLLFEIKYTEYLDRFDQLWLLSRESVAAGFLDTEAEKWGKKIKKQPVSKQILGDLLYAREKLTKNILKHPKLNNITEEELDESVQMILDRLIFIRTCEDRGIEEKHLISALRGGRGLSPALQKIFRDFNGVYNSGLFEEHSCDKLTIDDEVTGEVVELLYHSKDQNIHYDFSVINADVLGNIYEQYLGHILKKTPKSAKLKEKHQHRKEQGIYYTPGYIVDYMVKNTLGEMLKTMEPKDAEKIKILDPACGSGSFLIRAFDELFNYWQEKLPGQLGSVRKFRILNENIYGVDLDKQAVEITQMNLLLKSLDKGEKLPYLKNIRQGNSLISGTEEELKNYFGEEWKKKHPFNWRQEFPEVFPNSGHCGLSTVGHCGLSAVGHSEAKPKNPVFEKAQSDQSLDGFDIIIGNPPYVMVENLSTVDREYLMKTYETAIKRFDIYIAFIEEGLKLLKPGGLLSFIIPYPFLNQNYAELLRKNILLDFNLLQILDLSDIKVFGDAIVRNCVIVIEKPTSKESKKIKVKKVYSEQEIQKLSDLPTKLFKPKFFLNLPKSMYRTDLDDAKVDLLESVENKSISVGQICYVNWGARSGNVEKYVVNSPANGFCKKMINARNVGRYLLNCTNDYLVYKKEELYNPMFEELFESPKIIVRDISGRARLKATLDFEKYYAEHTVNLVVPYLYLQNVKRRGLSVSQDQVNNSRKYDLRYILANINSKLVNWYFISKLGGGLHVYPDDVKQLPIRKIDFLKPEEKKMHDDLVKLADRMLDLNKQLQALGDKLTDERKKLEAEIQKTDKEIDDLVYKLYDLTEEEIKIIEQGVK